MLLEDLAKIVKQGAAEPLELWLSDFETWRRPALAGVGNVLAGLTPGSSVAKQIAELLRELKKKRPNELRLVNALRYVATLFEGGNMPLKQQEFISGYIIDCQKFLAAAQVRGAHRQTRISFKKQMLPEARQKHDLKLFQNEGMMYCLEYYLAMYKAIIDAPDEAGKRQYIENLEIELGFGKVPGLWIDFTRDEVLDKFVYSILDNSARSSLMKAYYETKSEFMKVAVSHDTERATADYSDTNLANVIEAFKLLCQALLDEYARMGVERLASFFFKPYGDKPLIKDIKL